MPYKHEIQRCQSACGYDAGQSFWRLAAVCVNIDQVRQLCQLLSSCLCFKQQRGSAHCSKRLAMVVVVALARILWGWWESLALMAWTLWWWEVMAWWWVALHCWIVAQRLPWFLIKSDLLEAAAHGGEAATCCQLGGLGRLNCTDCTWFKIALRCAQCGVLFVGDVFVWLIGLFAYVCHS